VGTGNDAVCITNDALCPPLPLLDPVFQILSCDHLSASLLLHVNDH
jgi:hypothetical protein